MLSAQRFLIKLECLPVHLLGLLVLALFLENKPEVVEAGSSIGMLSA